MGRGKKAVRKARKKAQRDARKVKTVEVEPTLDELHRWMGALNALSAVASGMSAVLVEGKRTMVKTGPGFSAAINRRIARNVQAIQVEHTPYDDQRKLLMTKYEVPEGCQDDHEWAQENPKAWQKFKDELEEVGAEQVSLKLLRIELPPEAPGVEVPIFIALSDFLTVKGEEDDDEDEEPKPRGDRKPGEPDARGVGLASFAADKAKRDAAKAAKAAKEEAD